MMESLTVFDQIKKNWELILQAAVWLSSAVLLAISSPPRFLAGGLLLSEPVVRAAELILAICIAVAFFVFRSSEGAKSAPKYAAVGVAFLGAAVLSFMLYQFQLASWTCTYDGRGPVTVGTTLTADASDFMRLHPEATCSYLIQVSGGQVEKIWPTSEMIGHHLMMVSTFLFSVISFALAALLVTFALTAANYRSADE
jgi:hypothetical protein